MLNLLLDETLYSSKRIGTKASSPFITYLKQTHKTAKIERGKI